MHKIQFVRTTSKENIYVLPGNDFKFIFTYIVRKNNRVSPILCIGFNYIVV